MQAIFVLLLVGLYLASVRSETNLLTEPDTAVEPPSNKRNVFCTRDKGYIYSENAFVVRDSPLAHQLLGGGCGIEIGPGACNPFNLNTIHVGLSREMDSEDYDVYSNGQRKVCGAVAPIDVAAHADDLWMFGSSSVDFVLTSHVWDHLPDPLAALLEWVRVTRDEGVLFAIVPHRTAAHWDAGKPVTSIDTLMELHRKKATLADFPSMPMEFRHLQVFSMDLLLQIMLWFNRERFAESESLSLVAALEVDDKPGNGHLIAWRVSKNETRHRHEISLM